MAIDPLTYADLCNNGSCEVHDEGEIWATVLWDMRHDLILQYGFDEGKLRSEQVVVDRMKLSACSPNFVTMRDSILQADQQRYAGQDECLIRSAFAWRGLGALATSNGTGGDATADFTLVAPLDDSVSFAADHAMLSWNARQGAVSYPVDRGTFGPDATSNTFSDAACLGDLGRPRLQIRERATSHGSIRRPLHSPGVLPVLERYWQAVGQVSRRRRAPGAGGPRRRPLPGSGDDHLFRDQFAAHGTLAGIEAPCLPCAFARPAP